MKSKKMMIITFLVVVGVVSLYFMYQINSDRGELTSFDITDNLNKVRMSIKESTITAKGLTLVFTNDDEREYEYSAIYSIEVLKNKKWYKLPYVFDGSNSWTTEAYDLSTSKSSEWSTEWDGLYGILDKGHYRIIKPVKAASNNDEVYYLTAEFDIK